MGSSSRAGGAAAGAGDAAGGLQPRLTSGHTGRHGDGASGAWLGAVASRARPRTVQMVGRSTGKASMVAVLLVLHTVGLVDSVQRPAQASHGSGCGEFVRHKACSPNSTAPGSQRKHLMHDCRLVQCTGTCGSQNQSGCCEFDSFGGGDCAWIPQGSVVSGKPSHSAALCRAGQASPPPPPAPGPPTATTSCVGCW